jgi:hypothetical protein
MNASLIESKFLRSRPKLDFTKLWSETNNSIKETILKNVNLCADEVPIINCYQDNHHWWLLSNDSLYIMNSTIGKYKFKEFDRVEIPQNFYQDVSNGELSTIQIRSESSHIELIIEPLSWSVIYSILKFVVRK